MLCGHFSQHEEPKPSEVFNGHIQIVVFSRSYLLQTACVWYLCSFFGIFGVKQKAWWLIQSMVGGLLFEPDPQATKSLS